MLSPRYSAENSGLVFPSWGTVAGFQPHGAGGGHSGLYFSAISVIYSERYVDISEQAVSKIRDISIVSALILRDIIVGTS